MHSHLGLLANIELVAFGLTRYSRTEWISRYEIDSPTQSSKFANWIQALSGKSDVSMFSSELLIYMVERLELLGVLVSTVEASSNNNMLKPGRGGWVMASTEFNRAVISQQLSRANSVNLGRKE